MRRTFRWDKQYLYWGITAFCVIAACVLFYVALENITIFKELINTIIRIVGPFIWGLVFTYFLAPLVNQLERNVFRPLFNGPTARKAARILHDKTEKNKEKAEYKNSSGSTRKNRLARAISVFIAEIVLLVIITALVALIIPQLYTSVANVVLNSNSYLETATEWLKNSEWLQKFPDAEKLVTDLTGDVTTSIGTWLKDTILPGLGTVVSSLSSGVYQTVKAIYNLVIGVIVSVYLLGDKEHFGANSLRLLYSVFSVDTAEKIRTGLTFTDRTFRGFFTGKLLDSAIIGVICYIGCAIMQTPYALLVSVMIGVTNIIPFFGPVIGAVPAALLILFVDPFKCLLFVIFVLVLQQVDGNFLGPKILGSSVGISGFWVMFSILVGAGFFGFWGMLLGVPVFTVLLAGLKQLVDRKLERKDLPLESEQYVDLQRIDPATLRLIYKKDNQPDEVRLPEKNGKDA